MRSRHTGSFAALATLVTLTAATAEPPRRKPLDQNDRVALLALLGAVDAAQHHDGESSESTAPLSIEHHVLKSGDQYGYVPFRLALPRTAAPMKSPMLYVRAVSRHHGYRTSEERSSVREWLARGGDQPLPRQETVFVGPGEMP